MADIGLLGNDLDFTGGKMHLVEDLDEVRQKVQIRLQFFKGEWFLDQNIGIPYFDQVFVKNPKFSIVQKLLRSAVLSTPGVKDVINFGFDYDNTTRALSVAFQVLTDFSVLPLDFSREFIL